MSWLVSSVSLMSETAGFVAAQQLVERIRSAFPEDAVYIDEKLASGGFSVGDVPYLWVEHFSQQTTDALKRGDTRKVKMHFELLSRLLVAADEATVRCIDVAYVESLMWDIKSAKFKRTGWRLMPANLRSLYSIMWGERPFMDRGKEG